MDNEERTNLLGGPDSGINSTIFLTETGPIEPKVLIEKNEKKKMKTIKKVGRFRMKPKAIEPKVEPEPRVEPEQNEDNQEEGVEDEQDEEDAVSDHDPTSVKTGGDGKQRQKKTANNVLKEFMEKKIQKIPTTFDEPEEYDTTVFPWPVQNKDLQLLNIHGFPFEKVGALGAKMKKSSLEKDLPKKHKINKLTNEVLDEAIELFSKVGYEAQLLQWLTSICTAEPQPPDPYDYLKRTITTEVADTNEYARDLEELKRLLGLENMLAFELAQIKLLCGMIDESSYGIDGKSREEWDRDIKKRRDEIRDEKLKCLGNELRTVEKQIAEEIKKDRMGKERVKALKRETILSDLQMWKAYVRPRLEVVKRDKGEIPDDGRKRDWFEGLQAPGKEKSIQSSSVESDPF